MTVVACFSFPTIYYAAKNKKDSPVVYEVSMLPCKSNSFCVRGFFYLSEFIIPKVDCILPKEMGITLSCKVGWRIYDETFAKITEFFNDGE